MKRLIPVLYFIGLFLILASYMLFAAPNISIRISVASSEVFAQDRPNFVQIVVRDLDHGSKFQGFKLRSCWVTSDKQVVLGSSCIERELPENGQVAMETPILPTQPIAALSFDLLDESQDIVKTAYVTTDKITILGAQAAVMGVLAQTETADIREVMAPGAFLLDTSNDVWITTIHQNAPRTESIQIKQIYGQPAEFVSEITPGGDGIAHLKMTLQSPADFEFSQGNDKFYASFVNNNRPLHASVQDSMLIPDHPVMAVVVPFGQMPTITVDTFDEDAWIGHQSYPPSEARHIGLNPPSMLWEKPHIIYIRISASAIATPDSSQTFAMIAYREKLSVREQAFFVLEQAKDMLWPEIAVFKRYLETHANGEAAARRIRDWVLSKMAAGHAPAVDIRMRTESGEMIEFEAQKSAQKSIANKLLLFWFIAGMIMFISHVALQARVRRQAWLDLAESNPAPKQPYRAFYLSLIVFLVLAMAAMIFYMMQII